MYTSSDLFLIGMAVVATVLAIATFFIHPSDETKHKPHSHS